MIVEKRALNSGLRAVKIRTGHYVLLVGWISVELVVVVATRKAAIVLVVVVPNFVSRSVKGLVVGKSGCFILVVGSREPVKSKVAAVCYPVSD